MYLTRELKSHVMEVSIHWIWIWIWMPLLFSLPTLVCSCAHLCDCFCLRFFLCLLLALYLSLSRCLHVFLSAPLHCFIYLYPHMNPSTSLNTRLRGAGRRIVSEVGIANNILVQFVHD